MIIYRTDRDALDAVMPEPLALDEPPVREVLPATHTCPTSRLNLGTVVHDCLKP